MFTRVHCFRVWHVVDIYYPDPVPSLFPQATTTQLPSPSPLQHHHHYHVMVMIMLLMISKAIVRMSSASFLMRLNSLSLRRHHHHHHHHHHPSPPRHPHHHYAMTMIFMMTRFMISKVIVRFVMGMMLMMGKLRKKTLVSISTLGEVTAVGWPEFPDFKESFFEILVTTLWF